MRVIARVDDLTQAIGVDHFVDLELEQVRRIAAVDEAHILRNGLVEEDEADGGVDHLGERFAVVLAEEADLDLRLKIDDAGLVGADGLVDVRKDAALALGAGAHDRQVVRPEDHVLRGDDDGLAVLRLQNVVARTA